MGYVIAAIIVVVVVAAGISVFVRAAATRRGQATIAAPDEGTPLGDTSEHAGEQSREGATVSDPDAEATRRGSTDPTPGVGGTGAGGAGGEGEGSRPVSEDLVTRPG